MERLVVTRAPHALLAEPLEETEGGKGLEDRRPHGVEVDGRRHDRDERLVGRELGERELLHVHRAVRILVVGREAGEHLLLLGLHDGAASRFRERQRTDVFARSVLENGGTNRVDL